MTSDSEPIKPKALTATQAFTRLFLHARGWLAIFGNLPLLRQLNDDNTIEHLRQFLTQNPRNQLLLVVRSDQGLSQEYLAMLALLKRLPSKHQLLSLGPQLPSGVRLPEAFALSQNKLWLQASVDQSPEWHYDERGLRYRQLQSELEQLKKLASPSRVLRRLS